MAAGTTPPSFGWLLLQVLRVDTELEADHIRMRTRESMAVARAPGPLAHTVWPVVARRPVETGIAADRLTWVRRPGWGG